VAGGNLLKIISPSFKKPYVFTVTGSVTNMKFTFGKKQTVDTVELDNLFTDLQGVLQKHPLVPAANVDALVSEWINDLLFLAGKITEQELQEAMQTFETAETTPEAGGEGGKKAEDEDDDDDSDDDED
jgi:hypothetical protein